MLFKSLKAILLSLCFTFIVIAHAYGGVPQLINYQGTLTNVSGTPVPNSQYAVVFSIYDSLTNGQLLWTETWNAGTNSVSTLNGGFNVMLGTYTVIPASFFADHPVTYLGVKVGNDSEMAPRQRITSVGYAFTAGNGVPKNGIIMWSGSVDSNGYPLGVNGVPDTGWHLCDGSNGTPNLRDRFVIGAGGTYAKDAYGGSTTKVLSHDHAIPSHSHTVSGTAAANPGAEHTVDDTGRNDRSVSAASHTHSVTGATSATSAGTTGSGLNSAAQDIMPPYYALAFIMKL